VPVWRGFWRATSPAATVTSDPSARCTVTVWSGSENDATDPAEEGGGHWGGDVGVKIEGGGGRTAVGGEGIPTRGLHERGGGGPTDKNGCWLEKGSGQTLLPHPPPVLEHGLTQAKNPNPTCFFIVSPMLHFLVRTKRNV